MAIFVIRQRAVSMDDYDNGGTGKKVDIPNGAKAITLVPDGSVAEGYSGIRIMWIERV